MISVFDFTDYKSFLLAEEARRAAIQRGFRSRLAEFLGCQNAYISHILNTGAHFSLEQGLLIAEYLRLTSVERKYFLLLIEHARAGTAALKNVFKIEIDEQRNRNLSIKEKVPKAAELSFENQSVYYSSWIFPTIHMLVTIPEFRTSAKIASALNIAEKRVHEAILFLVSVGLITERSGELISGTTQIHLGKDSPFVRQHHRNWRGAVSQHLSSQEDTGIHYSTVSSLSHEDAELLKAKMVKFIQKYTETIQPSKEETLYNFNLDFYCLIKK